MGAIPNLAESRIYTLDQDTAPGEIPFVWADSDLAPFPLAAIVLATCLYYDAEPQQDAAGGIINARNGAAIITAGVVTPGLGFRYATDPLNESKLTLFWAPGVLDTVVRHPELDSELHGLLFLVTTTGGGPWADQYGVRIRNLRRRGV